MNDPQQSRPPSGSRDTLAERLRKGREAKGVTPEVASEQSSVPIRYVRMFEEGEYPVVADPAYLAHFVRRYAGYLGLDAETASRDLIAETEPETALRRAGKVAPPKRDGKPASAPLLSVEPTIGGKPVASDGRKLPTLRGAGGRRKAGADSLPLIAVGVVVTGVAFAAFHFWSKRVTSAGPEQVAASPTAALPAAEPTLAAADEAAVAPTQAAPTALPTQPVVIATAVPPPATVATAQPRPAPTAVLVPTHPPTTPHLQASPRVQPPPPSRPRVSEPPPRASAPSPATRPARRRSADEEASDALRAEQLERLKQRMANPPAAEPPPQQP